MAPAPGMAAPPGMSPPNVHQANRPGGLPPNFQPPPNLPNINFNAPIIRLGTGATGHGGRGDGPSAPAGGRPGLGMDRGGGDQARDRGREVQQMLIPPTPEDRLCTVLFHGIPDGLGGDEGVHKICNAIGKLRKWESSVSLWAQHKPLIGFATFDDHDSIALVHKLFREQTFEVPVKRQEPTAHNPSSDETFKDIEKTRLMVSLDDSAMEFLASFDENRAEDPDFRARLEQATAALKQVQRHLFYPPIGSQADGDTVMADADAQKNVEVVNISIAQEDELADIPADMREIVAKEIAAFRDRSTRRDMERLRREEEIGARFRQQNGASGPSLGGGANHIPLGPRAATTAPTTAPTGPKGGQNGADRGQSFVNGGGAHDQQGGHESDLDTNASDQELLRRKMKKKEDEENKHFREMERKWIKRDDARQSAIDREFTRERREDEQRKRHREEQRGRDSGWDDLAESMRRSHLYYRNHAEWARGRATDLQDEERRDEKDRLLEKEEQRQAEEQMEQARGQADSFLDQQDREAERRRAEEAAAAAAAPQPIKLSLGLAAQRAQASRNKPQRRTMAEVEGLLDDEDTEPVVRRPLVPIQPEALKAAASSMTEEEISQAVRSLAQEIPSDRDGLWAWRVEWEHLDSTIVQERLRPFVEKKIVEYLGVQEEMLVQTVEEQLRKQGTAAALAEELGEALGDEAEDLVKKLWRMVIFFTECGHRGLPA